MEVKPSRWVPVMRNVTDYARELEEQLDGEDCGEGEALVAANLLLVDPMGCGFECQPDDLNTYCPQHGEGGSETNEPLCSECGEGEDAHRWHNSITHTFAA